MLKNYFKIAWRNIVRSKGYSALNIFGLATGMAVALLMGCGCTISILMINFYRNTSN